MIINLLGKPTKPSSFRIKNWFKLNDNAHGTYNINSQIKFKTTMLMSRLCNCSVAYIFVKRT